MLCERAVSHLGLLSGDSLVAGIPAYPTYCMVALRLQPHAFDAMLYDEVPRHSCHIGGSSLLKKLQKTEPSVCVGAWMAK